jgi:pilus assembly protein CpaB
VAKGERVAEVVAAGPPDVVNPGARVDVVVTREPRPGAPGGTDLALEDVEVLQAAPAAADSGPPRIAASLRVTVRQAVYLAAAQSFARELRLLPRAHGDHRRAGALSYGATLG